MNKEENIGKYTKNGVVNLVTFDEKTRITCISLHNYTIIWYSEYLANLGKPKDAKLEV